MCAPSTPNFIKEMNQGEHDSDDDDSIITRKAHDNRRWFGFLRAALSLGAATVAGVAKSIRNIWGGGSNSTALDCNARERSVPQGGNSSQSEDAVFPTNLTATSDERRIREEMNHRLREEGHEGLLRTTRLSITVATWNVAQQPPQETVDMRRWLLGDELTDRLENSAAGQLPLAAFPDVVVVGLQEVEFGGVALMVETTESSVDWMEAVTDCLNKAVQWRVRFKKLRTVQLVGIVLIVIVRSTHEPFVHHVKTSLSRTGAVGGMMGNKGSIGLRMTMYGKRFLFICAHFHPHLKNEKTRMKNYHNALSELKFKLPIDADDEFDIVQFFDDVYRNLDLPINKKQLVGAALSPSVQRENRTEGQSTWSRFFALRSSNDEATLKEWHVLESHDYVFFFGDLNYRLHGISGSEVRSLLEHKTVMSPGGTKSSSKNLSVHDDREGYYDHIIEDHDELKLGMQSRKLFAGFQESAIHFPPTYKYDIGTDRYDSSPKQRDPAWTDRILFRSLDTAEEDNLAVLFNVGNSSITSLPSNSNLELPKAPDAEPDSNNAEEQGAGLAEIHHSESSLLTLVEDDDQEPNGPLTRSKSLEELCNASQSSLPYQRKSVFAPNRLVAREYNSVSNLRLSDHKPVTSTFEVDVLNPDKETVQACMLLCRDLWDQGHCDVDGHL